MQYKIVNLNGRKIYTKKNFFEIYEERIYTIVSFIVLTGIFIRIILF